MAQNRKQSPTFTTLPDRLPGESDRAYEKRFFYYINGDDVRSRTDLKDWTGCPPMHLNVEDSQR